MDRTGKKKVAQESWLIFNLLHPNTQDFKQKVWMNNELLKKLKHTKVRTDDPGGIYTQSKHAGMGPAAT